MSPQDLLTDDGHAMLLLCSAFGLGEQPPADGLEPLKLSEWNQLAPKIKSSPLQSPAGIAGLSAADLSAKLQVPVEEAERLAKLLARGTRVALELDQLFAKGMWAVTRADPQYPARLRETLKHQAPSVLFGAGEVHLLRRKGVAVVGSRNIDAAGTAFAQEVGRKLAAGGAAVISGGARGSDRLAMQAALEAGSTAVGALADSLERTIRQPDVRQLLIEGQLALLTPYAPTAGFSVGAAMGRNKIIYGLAEFAVVVSSDFRTGGTWAGATEALKAGWCPVFVRDGDDLPKGNRELVRIGATALPECVLAEVTDLPSWLREHQATTATQPDLFSSALRETPKGKPRG